MASLQQGRVLVIGTQAIANHRADYEIVRKMRASILVLGPMLARDGHAVVSLPGGCAIGARPVDLHLRGLEALGAELDLRDGYVHATAPERPARRGRRVPHRLGRRHRERADGRHPRPRHHRAQERRPRARDRRPRPVPAPHGRARSPAKAPPPSRSQGVDRLHGATHPVVADRIELGTYMLAPAIAGGEVELVGGRRELVGAFADKLEEAGIEVSATNTGLKVAAQNGRVRAVDVATAPFPGFPTDLQAQMMALLTLADGISHLEERIFENRFMHAPELVRMGAQHRGARRHRHRDRRREAAAARR